MHVADGGDCDGAAEHGYGQCDNEHTLFHNRAPGFDFRNLRFVECTARSVIGM